MASGYMRGISPAKNNKSGGSKGKRKTSNEHRAAQPQNVKAARVYVFGDNDIAEEDENVEFEMPELRTRQRGVSVFTDAAQENDDAPTFFEREVADGETLQAIALKYACPVSELKRLNNLIKDQEFFALKVVKVPMKKHGVLSEELKDRLNIPIPRPKPAFINGVLSSPSTDEEHYSNYFEESDSQADFSDPDTQMKVMRTISIRDHLSKQGKEAEKFLHKMDKDLSKLKKQSSRTESRESLTEVISVLTNKSIHPLQSNQIKNRNNGADCGMTWRNALILFLVVGIVLPLLFLVYLFFFNS